MGEWVVSLIRNRALELAVALALGYALARAADQIAAIPVVALAQHVSDTSGVPLVNLFSAGVYLLNFRLGSTLIFYGQALASLLALGLVLALALVVMRLRDRELERCPSCASRIPHVSTHCAYCGSIVTAAES